MIFIYIICSFLFAGLLFLLILPYPKKVNQLERPGILISILIAARNEDKNIEECIISLFSQNYPSNALQIIVGDDDSEDSTLDILINLQEKYPALEVYSIREKYEGLNGKTNVLAQIDQYAKGDILLFTDADTVANPNWVETMVAAFEEKVGIVTGMTVPSKTHSFLQSIDWVYALIQVIKISSLGIATTSMGNNMGVKSKAYFEIGGYAAIKNTLTEDFELFHQIIKAGYKHTFIFQKESVLKTKPVEGILTLLYQRKRWMTGAVNLHKLIVVILLLLAGFYPVIIYLIFNNLILGLSIWGVKVLLQSLIIFMSFQRLEMSINPFKLLLYEIYSLFLTLGVLLFYILPIKVKWKGRTYN